MHLPAGTPLLQNFQAVRQIARSGRPAGRTAADKVTLRDHRGKITGEITLPPPGSCKEQPGKAGMKRDDSHLPAERSYAHPGIQRTEELQKTSRLGHGRSRRSIGPWELRRIVHPPEGQIQRQLAQIGDQDLRRIIGEERTLFVFAPETVADSRCYPSCTAGALSRGRGGEPGSDQTVHAA